MDTHERWLAKAKSDLALAQNVLDNKEESFFDAAIYHTQQCAEKSLKAFLVFKQYPIVKTHDLLYLLVLCIDQEDDFKQLKNQAMLLNPFSTELRYPGDDFDIDEMPTIQVFGVAVAAARDIFDFVVQKIG
jgi:HEPN domain-containing protein